MRSLGPGERVRRPPADGYRGARSTPRRVAGSGRSGGGEGGGAGPGSVRGMGRGCVRARANHKRRREGRAHGKAGKRRGGPGAARSQSGRHAALTRGSPGLGAPVGRPGRGVRGRAGARARQAGLPPSPGSGSCVFSCEREGALGRRSREVETFSGPKREGAAAARRQPAPRRPRRSSGPAAPSPPLPLGPSACGAVAGHRGCGGRRPGGGGAADR